MRRLLLVAALVVVLVGCSDDGGTPTASGGDAAGQDAAGGGGDTSAGEGCSLIDGSEVAEIADVEVLDATELPMGCQWTVAPAGSSAAWEWQSLPAGGFESNRSTAEEISSMEVVDIDGLGDEAFLRAQVTSDGEVRNGETWVQVGDQSFFVRTTAVAWDDEVEAAQEELAALVADRLGAA